MLEFRHWPRKRIQRKLEISFLSTSTSGELTRIVMPQRGRSERFGGEPVVRDFGIAQPGGHDIGTS